MLRVWNVTLVIITFFLTIFGTFMTRSGVVQSVHAFGDDPILAKLFTGFMVRDPDVQLRPGHLRRLPLLKARNELDSWLSREAAFLVNNWVLLFAALFVLFATMFPTLSEAVTGHRLTVAAPFFNKWMVPIGFVLLFLTGVGPLLAWRKSTLTNLRDSFIFPVSAAVVTAGALAALGVRVWSSGLCFALCAMVVGTIVQEFWRGGNIRRKNTGTDMFTAIVGLVGRNKRRYGGYIVHVGIVLIFLGFAGNGFKKDEQVLLKPGQRDDRPLHDPQRRPEGERRRAEADDDGVSVGLRRRQADRHAVSGEVGVPQARAGADDRGGDPAHVRRGPVHRAGVSADDLATQTATLQIVVNPLVNWIWFGFGIMAIGTGIALLPERSFAFALAKLPVEAAATTVALLLAMLVYGGTTLSAQRGMGSPADQNVQASFYARNDFEKQMQHEIVCTCGACGHQTIAECRKDPCVTSHEMRGELAALIDQGKTHDEIIQAFIAKHGSEEMLGAPLDKGFSRLAWLFPYLVGATSAIAVGFAAVKWTRKPDAADRGRAARFRARRAHRR